MALTADEITICNEAMGYLGEYIVEASAVTTSQYLYCERYYDQSVNEVLCEHPWNEAKKRAIVMQDATAPLFGYDYRFAIPADFLTLWRIGDGQVMWDKYVGGTEMWEVEDGYILTNVANSPRSYAVGTVYVAGQYITYSNVTYLVDTGFTATVWATDLAAYLTSQVGDYLILNIEYEYTMTTIASWSPKLRKAIAQNLAVNVAAGLTNDPKTKADLLKELEYLTLRKARSIDGKQGKIRQIFKSRWWRSRY